MKKLVYCFSLLFVQIVYAQSDVSQLLPTLTSNHKGQPVMYWAEKEDNSNMSLFFATSPDHGKTFGEKQLIYTNPGIGAGRLARPKLLFKTTGEMVAVFSMRTVGGVAIEPLTSHAGHGAPAAASAGGRPKRESQIQITSSKDGGKTWTTPQNIDPDPAPAVRGFFDAVMMANNEVAVAYLKDVKDSKKHEERDLRMVFTKNGELQPERLIDPVVCDCCNISLLVDPSGALHVYYRDNNNEIRDIAEMVSKDNGATFGASKILHADQWEIHGCPHSGAMAAATATDQYITWFSGTEKGNPGVRIVNSKGQLLGVLPASAKNATVATDALRAVWAWEEMADGKTSIAYATVENGKLMPQKSINDTNGSLNVSMLLVNGKTLLSFEKVKENKKSKLETVLID